MLSYFTLFIQLFFAVNIEIYKNLKKILQKLKRNPYCKIKRQEKDTKLVIKYLILSTLNLFLNYHATLYSLKIVFVFVI